MKEEAAPCVCQCNIQKERDSESWVPSTGICLVIIGLVGLLANVALAFKIPLTNRGDQRELSLVVSQQKGSGKSKGFFGPSRGLKSTG